MKKKERKKERRTKEFNKEVLKEKKKKKETRFTFTDSEHLYGPSLVLQSVDPLSRN